MATYEYKISFESNLDLIAEQLKNLISSSGNVIKISCDTKDIERAKKLIENIKPDKNAKILLEFDNRRFLAGLSNLESYSNKSAKEISDSFKKQMADMRTPVSLNEWLDGEDLNVDNIKKKLEGLRDDINGYEFKSDDFLGMQEQGQRLLEFQDMLQKAKAEFGHAFDGFDFMPSSMFDDLAKNVGQALSSTDRLDVAIKGVTSSLEKAQNEFAEAVGRMGMEGFTEAGQSAQRMGDDITEAINRAIIALEKMASHVESLKNVFVSIGDAGNEFSPLLSMLEKVENDIKAIYQIGDMPLNSVNNITAMVSAIGSLHSAIGEIKSETKSFSDSLGEGFGEANGIKKGVDNIRQSIFPLMELIKSIKASVKDLNTSLSKDLEINIDFGKMSQEVKKAKQELAEASLPMLRAQENELGNILGKRLTGNTATYGMKGYSSIFDASTAKQMQGRIISAGDNPVEMASAIKKNIDEMKKLASIKGIDISGWSDSFDKTADEIVADIDKITVSSEKLTNLQQIFGGGMDYSAQFDGLTASLENLSTIIDKTFTLTDESGDVKNIVTELSNGVDVLEQSFNSLSETISKTFNLGEEGNSIKSFFDGIISQIQGFIGDLEKTSALLKELTDKGTAGTQADTKIAENTNIGELEKLREVLNGLPEDKLDAIYSRLNLISENASKFVTGLNSVADAFKHFGDTLDGISDESKSFISDIQQMLRKGEALSNLAKILNESKTKINQARDALLGNTDQLRGEKFLKDNETTIRDTLSRHFKDQDGGSVRSTQMSIDKNGLVKVRALVEGVNGEFKDYTLTVDRAFGVTVNKVAEGTSALERMKAATEALNISHAEEFTWTPDSEGWETLRVAVVEYEEELGKLQSITRSLRQDNNGNWLESFKLKGEKGSKTIGPRLDDDGMPSIVAETSNIAMIDDIEKRYTKALQNMQNSAKKFNSGTDTLINKSAFEEANAEMDKLEAELKELVAQEIITQSQMDEIVNKRKKANAQIDKNPITDKEYLQAQKDMDRLYKELGEAQARRVALDKNGEDSSYEQKRISHIIDEIRKTQELCRVKEEELSLTKQQQAYNSANRLSATSSMADKKNTDYDLKLSQEEQNMRNRQTMSYEEKRGIVSSVSKNFDSGKYEAEITKLRDSFIKAGQSVDYAESQVEELRAILSELGNATGIDEVIAASQKWSSTLQSVKNDLTQVQSASSIDKMTQGEIGKFQSILTKYANDYRSSMRDDSNKEKTDNLYKSADALLKQEDKLRQLANEGRITNDQLNDLIRERDNIFSQLNIEKQNYTNGKFNKLTGGQSEEDEYKKNLTQLENLYKERARLEEMITKERNAGKVTDSMEKDFANVNSDISALEKRTVELEQNVIAEDRLADAISKREARMQEAEAKGRREGERAISSANDREINKNFAKAQKGTALTLANDSGQKNINFMLSQFQKFRATSEEARADVERLQSAYNELGSAGEKSAQEQIEAWEKYQQVLKETKAELNNLKKNDATIDQRNQLIADIEKFRANNTRAEKNFGGQFDALEKELRESEGTMEHFRAEWKALQADITSSGQTGLTFMSSFGNRFRESLMTAFSYVSIYDFFNVFRQGFEQVTQLDTALTEMRKVSDESLQSLQRYQNLTFDFAGQIGTTALQLQQSTADWMRLNS